MSQVDIGAGNAVNRIAKGGTGFHSIPAPRVELAAPGLATLPATSSGLAIANELAQAVGVAGQVVVSNEEYWSKRRGIDHRNDAMLKALDEGHAAEYWGKDSADILQKIDNGDIRAADGASLEEVAHIIAADKVSGLPPELQDAYHKIADPHIANALRDRQKTDQRLAASDLHDTLSSAASATSDPTELNDLVAKGSQFKTVLNMTDDQNLWAVLGPAAEAAASTGDTAKLGIINEILGDRFKDKQVQLQNTARIAQNQQQMQAELGATRAIDGMMEDQPVAVTRQAVMDQRKALNDAFPGRSVGDAWALPHLQRLDTQDRVASAQTKENEAEQQRQVLKDAENQVSALIVEGKSGDAMTRIGELSQTIPNGETWALTQVNRVLEWDKKGEAESERLYEQQWRKSQVRDAADVLRQSGGAFSLPPDGLTLERPGGKPPIKISYDDLVKGAVQVNFEAMDAAAAQRIRDVQTGTGSDNPEYVKQQTGIIAADTFKQKAKFVADNGTPWPEMTHVLSSGAALPNLESLSRIDPKTGKGVVDPQTMAGYSAWTSLAGNPGLRQRLATNPTARRFYEMTDLANANVTDGDAAKAMQMAYTTLTTPDVWNSNVGDRIAPSALTKAAASTGLEVGNQEFVNQRVHELARLAMGPAFRMSEGAALAWAADRVKEHTVVLNGYAVPKAGAVVPEIMPDAVKQIVHEWVTANPHDGYEAKDLTMRPGPNETWILCDRIGRTVDTHLYQTGAIQKAYLQGLARKRGEMRENIKAIQQQPVSDFQWGAHRTELMGPPGPIENAFLQYGR